MLDTFEGMTEPGKRDVDFTGADARGLLDVQKGQADGVLCYASFEEVKRNVESVGYPADLIHYVVGDIRRTALKLSDRRDIALLRLDTDFYDSTKVELETFYPRLRDNGVLIVDDYGHWQGAREAVDEYFDTLRQNGVHAPMLTVIDYTGRLAVK
jgi:O-methyltransferase